MEIYLTIIKNGVTIDHRDLGVRLLSFRKSPLTGENLTDKVQGRHGLINKGTQYDGRKLKATFMANALSPIDYQLQLDEISDLFSTETEMTIIESRQPGKKWDVKVDGDFEIEWIGGRNGHFEVNFIASLPFSQSLGTTLDPFTFNADVWQVGMNMPADTELNYRFSTNSFKVFNAGSVTVDPQKLPLDIQFRGESQNLTITNQTTGQMFKYTGTTTTSDVLVLKRCRHLKNNVSIYDATTHDVISLVPGWNQFSVSGPSSRFEVAFDFRFYYK